MPKLEECKSVLAELEKASRADKGLNDRIWVCLCWADLYYHFARGRWHFTGSLDATIALVERVLPGWLIASIGQDDHKAWHAELRKGHITSFSTVSLAGAPTPPLALLTALFRALIAQMEKADG
ncbi:hypothetical protein CHELA1G11_12004 [Hyphomicrobiales bacterium]|nr:hypothetical protein CHELA1G11_12004 [Hyphomicrobiales bacterium]CAH1663961.1 hypothetical protein CHELA1G2_12308 [Hyphomicrobiales bacterium]